MTRVFEQVFAVGGSRRTFIGCFQHHYKTLEALFLFRYVIILIIMSMNLIIQGKAIFYSQIDVF
ncbi:MAG: hypothetical protein K0S80_1696 [Neobacillus sp.]|nr:hypothetical protein [Neobacillus sp.]